MITIKEQKRTIEKQKTSAKKAEPENNLIKTRNINIKNSNIKNINIKNTKKANYKKNSNHKKNKELTCKQLQNSTPKQSALYLFCNFIASLLISAYSALMYSPTVQNIFPKGGDSRKQMNMIFILSLIGCIIFTIYAASLFFRKKSRQLGILMALGASKKRLMPYVFQEVLLLSSASSLSGLAAGFPFVWIIWRFFRLFLIDSQEMVLSFDFICLYDSLAFVLLIILFSCFIAYYYLIRTNIMDIIQEEHKNEPIKELGRWCLPVGILLLFAGAIVGYLSGSIYEYLFSAYPPSWLNITYAPVFVGLYLIMLYTILYGWSSPKKNPYKNLISKSMMKFQGKQTVNHLLVVTILIAGGCFASFFTPLTSVAALIEINNRDYDYAYHYRADQNLPSRSEVEALAAEHQQLLKDWKEADYLTLALDGYSQIFKDERHYQVEYFPILLEGKFISEQTFCQISGEKIEVSAGTYYCIKNHSETAPYNSNPSATKLTNPVTRKELSVQCAGILHSNLFIDEIGYYVLNHADYTNLSTGLSLEWMGKMVFFNADGTDHYDFANQLYHTFVASFEEECAISIYYNRIYKMITEEQGGVYWGDTDESMQLHLSDVDHFDFRSFWAYTPKFRIFDKNNFLQTFAVFLMVFLFISMICIIAALIICYTRCQTIALNQQYVFEDLKRLGASPDFLRNELRNQCKIVFQIPSSVGISCIYLLLGLLLYGNDGKLTFSEISGLLACFLLMLLLAGIIYLIYQKTVHMIQQQMGI